MLLNVLPHLPKHGLESILMSPAGQLQQEAEKLGVEARTCRSLDARFTWNPWKLLAYLRSFILSIRSIRRQLRELQPELVHANSIRAGLVATAATVGFNTPIIWHVHDTLAFHPFSPAIRIVAALSRRTSCIAVSRATGRTFAGAFLRHSIAAKTEVLHNAIRPNSTFSLQERSQLRSRLGVGDRFLIGCVAQICTRKNQVGLVEIFAEALKSRPEMVLLIAGSALFPCNGPYEQKLHQRIRELGISERVQLLGSRDDVPLLLETMDMLVLPSIHDPFPMIILESMAAGLPVAAFSVDGVPELIADGRTGWLVPSGDRVQMARTILWAERSPAQRRRLAEAARRTALTNSLPAYANTFAGILRARAVKSREHPQPLASATEHA